MLEMDTLESIICNNNLLKLLFKNCDRCCQFFIDFSVHYDPTFVLRPPTDYGMY